MSDLSVSVDLQENYKDYYQNGESKWRWLGALDKADNIISLCRGLSVNSLVEIGAGDGAILKRLSELSFANNFYALDISETGVDVIKNRDISQLRECAVFDGYTTPYSDQEFDLAILSHVVEHVEYPRKLLAEACRIAKYVYLEVPLEDTVRLPQDFTPDKVGHINFYSPKTFRRLVQTCNLKVLKQRITNPSKEIYTFQQGKKGLLDFYIKEAFLSMLPNVATEFFTYHLSILSTREEILEVRKS
ncbi:MAG: class I SAM-dependent methyltransferase [Leptolyngbyaceae cyanobacterium]